MYYVHMYVLCTDKHSNLKQPHLRRHTGAHLSMESAVSLGVGNHGGSVCMCQPYMHTDALHNMGRENTDIEQVWECAHSQTPSDDEATGLCLPVSSLPALCPMSTSLSPHCAAQEPLVGRYGHQIWTLRLIWVGFSLGNSEGGSTTNVLP